MKIISRVVMLLIPLSFVSCGISKSIKKADKHYAIGEYYVAGEKYKQLYKRLNKEDKDLRGYVAFRQGECYFHLNDARALTAYKAALNNKYSKEPIIYLHYGYVLQYQGKYKEALAQYNKYLEIFPNDNLALSGVEACENSAQWETPNTNYKMELEKKLNAAKSSNLSPAFVGGNTDAIIFTSNQQERNAANKKVKNSSAITGSPIFSLYSAHATNVGEWSVPERLNFFGETSQQDTRAQVATRSGKQNPVEYGVCSLTSDGKTMYFTYSQHVNGEDHGTKIYVTSRVSGEWEVPKEVKLFADSSISAAHPAVNGSGDMLYFVSDAPSGRGGKDIYFSQKIGNEWSEPRNVGAPINTPGDEMFPTLRADGQLFFASNGHPSYGGLDIFRAIPDTTGWIVQNIGAPFNSTEDDFGITFAYGTDYGLLTSARSQKKGSKSVDRIYSFVLVEPELTIEGSVTDKKGAQIDQAQLRLIGNDGTNVKMKINRSGKYKLNLNKNTQYAMLASARGYLNEQKTLQTNDADNQAYTINFQLSPIFKPSSLSSIFFESGHWEVSKASEPGLNSLVKMLKDNPNITIELAAHTDIVGDSLFNIELSQKRANSVVNYLISHGVEKDRLTATGYGFSKPIVADAELSTEYTFIPENQVLDKSFIAHLTPVQQDICNQINRRIEFKVLSTTYKLY